MHYAQAQHAQPKAPDGAPLPDPNAPYNQPMGEHVPPGHPYVHDPAQANDFRARFHRPLVAPSPFRSTIVPGSAPQEGAAQPQMSASAPPGGPSAPTANGPEPAPANQPTIDPQLGQARDEAAGVAGKLERS